MRRVVPAVLVVAVAFGGATAGVAGSSEVVVDATEWSGHDTFLPSQVDVPRGGTVRFVFSGTRSHSATDATGLDLYDSGVVAPGGPDEVVQFVAAGSYAVSCTLHVDMNAKVSVPVSVTPSSGPSGTRLTVRWASVVASGGLAYDVQLRKPGGDWKFWRDGTPAKSGTMDAKRVGTWRFRGRLVRSATGARSAWSRTATAQIG